MAWDCSNARGRTGVSRSGRRRNSSEACESIRSSSADRTAAAWLRRRANAAADCGARETNARHYPDIISKYMNPNTIGVTHARSTYASTGDGRRGLRPFGALHHSDGTTDNALKPMVCAHTCESNLFVATGDCRRGLRPRAIRRKCAHMAKGASGRRLRPRVPFGFGVATVARSHAEGLVKDDATEAQGCLEQPRRRWRESEGRVGVGRCRDRGNIMSASGAPR